MWIEAPDILKNGLYVFWNGKPIANICIGFEKLFSEKTAYWGRAEIILRIDAGPDGMPIARTATVHGLIQWMTDAEARTIAPGFGGPDKMAEERGMCE